MATTIGQSALLFPFVEGSHILALSLSVGLIFVLDLRFLGLAFRGIPVSRVMKQVMPWSIVGFAIMFFTGILLFVTHAEDAYKNNFFRVKMLLFGAGGTEPLLTTN